MPSTSSSGVSDLTEKMSGLFNSTPGGGGNNNNSNSNSNNIGGGGGGGGGIVPAQQTEKPEHYRYLKEFRVDQCPLFPQHKCLLHRPFLCFYWHFPNQRRRRPVRRRDGTFNYSPDTYCTKYDEGSGLCPDGDDCPFLHRTAGDTERRYHLRYFKTCMCVYETDSKGCCLKNGLHCAFAHGEVDKRPPVFDVREVQPDPELDSLVSMNFSQPTSAPTTTTLNNHIQPLMSNNQGGATDKNNILMIDDARWQDAAYVLIFYKTESCKRPPRICRQGYACPHYHNQRDRRRSPQYYKYRSTPCPSVKHGDEWGEPTLCEDGDECTYCHTRTEQQFHPEIYKSSKCHDVFSLSFCPRGPFCAFAHVESEMALNRTFPMEKSTLSDLVQSALPPTSQQQLQLQASSEPIDIYKSTSTNISQQQINTIENTSTDLFSSNSVTSNSFNYATALSYSSAVGGGGSSGVGSNSVKNNSNEVINNILPDHNKSVLRSGNNFMNGIMTYEERGESGDQEDGCYWLFPSSNTRPRAPTIGSENHRQLGGSPTDNTLLLLDDDLQHSSSGTPPPPIVSNSAPAPPQSLPTQQQQIINTNHHYFPAAPPPPQQQQQQLYKYDLDSPSSSSFETPPHSVFSTSGLLRNDVLYLPIGTLTSTAMLLKQQLDVLNQAIGFHSGPDSGQFGCLVCKQKDRYRSTVLLPCEHQVVCSQCTPLHCPVCHGPVRNRKHCTSQNGGTQFD